MPCPIKATGQHGPRSLSVWTFLLHFFVLALKRRVTTINQVTGTGRFPPPSTGWVNTARHRAGCRSKASWIARGAGPWARSANTNNGGWCRSLRRDNGRAQQFKGTPRWQLCVEEINWFDGRFVVMPRSVNAMYVKVISPDSKSQGIKVVVRKC